MNNQNQNPSPAMLPDAKKPIWTKFGERRDQSNDHKPSPSRQTNIEHYWKREALHAHGEQNTGGTVHPPPQPSRIAVVFAGSPSPGKASTTPNSASTVPNILDSPRNEKTGVRLLAQSFAQQAAQPSSATPPTSSRSTPSYSRGRPKGWKPGMSYAAMRGNTPPRWKTARSPRQPRVKAPLPGFGRRPGRPPRPISPPPKELYYKAKPRFVNFLCEWSGCKAELHNLDTLRRHIRVVHEIRGKWSCHWGQCKLDGCTDVRQWFSHLEEAHLVPFQWHIGDGPSNTRGTDVEMPDKSPDELPDFLMDSAGHQVTPSIKDQSIEDFATWKENRRKLKELLIQRDKNLPSESSESSEAGET